MKRVLLVACVVVALVSAVASAQTMGRIGLASDLAGGDCNLFDIPGIVEVHMFIYNLAGVAGVHFAAPKPDCWTGATWLFDNVPHAVFLGNTQDPVAGLAIGFGLCIDSPVHLGSIVYFSQGQAPSCCMYPVIKAQADGHPEFDSPIMILCSELTKVFGTAGFVSPINPDHTCDCMLPLATERTTWGGIKSLYR